MSEPLYSFPVRHKALERQWRYRRTRRSPRNRPERNQSSSSWKIPGSLRQNRRTSRSGLSPGGAAALTRVPWPLCGKSGICSAPPRSTPRSDRLAEIWPRPVKRCPNAWSMKWAKFLSAPCQMPSELIVDSASTPQPVTRPRLSNTAVLLRPEDVLKMFESCQEGRRRHRREPPLKRRNPAAFAFATA